ncbi:MAG: membrane-associated protein [Gammaproteobacteria bacterium]
MATIPVWFKLLYTLGVLVIVAIYWVRHSPVNFLWFSDIALIGAVPAMWLDNAFLASTLNVAVLIPELLWNVDYAGRLILRRRITGLTEYMFDPKLPLWLRTLSLFHVPLPFVLLWMVYAYGYVDSGLPGAIVLALVVLPLSYAIGPREKNINWVLGPARIQTRFHPLLYLALLTLGFVAVIFVPTHFLLTALFA